MYYAQHLLIIIISTNLDGWPLSRLVAFFISQSKNYKALHNEKVTPGFVGEYQEWQA